MNTKGISAAQVAESRNPGFLHRLAFPAPVEDGNSPPEWLHMCIRHKETADYLMDAIALDEIIVSAMTAPDTRSRVVMRPDGVMLLIKAMHLREGAEPEHFAAVRLWIDADRIVSTREEDIDAIVEMRERMESGKGPATTGAFLSEIVGSIYEDLEPLVDEMEDQAADIDELLAGDRADEISSSQLGRLRRRIAVFLRHLRPQRPMLETLIAADCPIFSATDHQMFVEHHDTVTRFIENLTELRDRTLIMEDQISRIDRSRIERISFLFTMIATLFLPLTFLTGLLGVNLGGIPYATSSYAFPVLFVICIGVALSILILFRKRGIL